MIKKLTSFQTERNSKSLKHGFTIVELLVVIVVIGILAAITIVAYTGISQKAIVASLQTDLDNASRQIKLFQASDPSNNYPGSVDDCPNPVSTNTCLKSSGSNDYTGGYIVDNVSNPKTFSLTETNGTIAYVVTDNSSPTDVVVFTAFVNALGGANGDYGASIVQTSDGGLAMTGNTASYGAGGADMYLAKYNSNGTLAWSKTWGSIYSDLGQSIVQTSDGGLAVAGYTAGYGAGNNDIFLAKYDSNGTLVWNKTWGGTGADIGYSTVQTSDNGLAVTGYTVYGAGGVDMFLAKYDSNGTLVWNKTWGGTGADVGQSIVQTSDGGLAITGSTASYGAGGNDVFLAKYDSNGTLVWNKTWGGAGADTGHSIVQTSDGGLAVAGNTASYGAGSADMFLAKYNSSGIINNCSSPMCQSPSATVTSPTATDTSPSATVTSPTATDTSPSATVTSPSATSTVVVAP